MRTYFEGGGVTLLHGDALDALRGMATASCDALCCDPPAGISFMGLAFDSDRGGRDKWIAWLAEILREARRVLKPGAHALVWALPRTSHWTATAVEDAGFQVRDVVTHLFATGFPKSADISKQLDKAAGATREHLGYNAEFLAKMGKSSTSVARGWQRPWMDSPEAIAAKAAITAPATDAAKQWAGWGTALKPAAEHWILARAPLSEPTISANVLRHGTGGLNVEAARIGTGGDKGVWPLTGRSAVRGAMAGPLSPVETNQSQGRWPANLVLSCHDCDPACDACPVRQLDAQSGRRSAGHFPAGGKVSRATDAAYGVFRGNDQASVYTEAVDGASRYFFVAKPSQAERNAGCEGLTAEYAHRGNGFSDAISDAKNPRGNHHPTVKPIALMRHLVRLVTPPGGTVLDCFAGSGSTGCAAVSEGFGFVGIDENPDYCEIAKRRILATPRPLPLALPVAEGGGA